MEEKYSELIGLWGKYWNERKPAELIKIFTKEFIYEDVPTHTVNHNGEELTKFMNSIYTMAPDIKWTLTNCFVKENKGCAEWLMVGTQTGPLEGNIPATNKPFEVKGASVFLFEGDKIKSCSDFSDLMTLLKQIGVVKK